MKDMDYYQAELMGTLVWYINEANEITANFIKEMSDLNKAFEKIRKDQKELMNDVLQ